MEFPEIENISWWVGWGTSLDAIYTAEERIALSEDRVEESTRNVAQRYEELENKKKCMGDMEDSFWLELQKEILERIGKKQCFKEY